MNKNFPNIKKVVHLSPEKKALLWEKISEKIQNSEKNVIFSPLDRHTYWERNTASQFIYANQKTMIVTIMTWISLIFAWGASFAAENSLPWDILYPIKIHINENIESAFTLGAENEAELQVERIEERIAEANKLSAKWKLNASTVAEIKSDISLYKMRYEKEKSRMTTGTRNKVDSTLEIRLNNILENLNIDSQNQVESKEKSSTKDSENGSSIINWSNESTSDTTQTQMNGRVDTWVQLKWDIDSNIESSVNLNWTIESEIDSLLETDLSEENRWEEDDSIQWDESLEIENENSLENNINFESEQSSSINVNTRSKLQNWLSIQ